MAFLAKRKHPRTTTRDGVKLYAPQGVEYATFDDLSSGGIRLIMDRDPAIGEILDMELRLSGMTKSIRVKARVIRVQASGKSYEIGAEFLSPQTALSQTLDSKVDQVVGPH